LRPVGTNALAVEVFAPEEKDLAITWVDWNPSPPDKNMGLWRGVTLWTGGDVTLRHPFVATRLEPGGQAALTGSVDLHNTEPRKLAGVLRVEFEGVRASETVELAAGETKTVSLAPERHPELLLSTPRLWWPYALGEPNLYTAKLSFELGGAASD